MTISFEHAQTELIKAYRNYHKTMNAQYANNKLGTIYWDEDNNPFQITRLQYCQLEIDRLEKQLEELGLQTWYELFPEDKPQ